MVRKISLFHSSMAESSSDKLHIAVFPWLAFGHLIPFLELSKLIAQKGHKISFISTGRNIQRLKPKIPPSLSSIIHLVELRLPAFPGLPPAAEATYDITSHQAPILKKAYDGLKDDLVSFLDSAAPDWIIYDFAAHWLPPLAANLGIARVYFSNFSAVFMANMVPPSAQHMLEMYPARSSPEEFTVPPKWVDFPTNVALRLFEGRRFISFLQSHSLEISDVDRTSLAICGCDVFAVKSSDEMEGDWLRLLGKNHQKAVIPIGLLPPSDEDLKNRESGENWEPINEWLNTQKNESVLYVAFGSEAVMSAQEVHELAVGLENSEIPFFWVLKKDDVVLPEGFEARVAGRGIIWTTWAPQLGILGHISVGATLTHCGWSSITESLCFGRPLVMLPLVLDHGLNLKIFEERKAGVEIPRDDEDGSFTGESVAKSIRLVLGPEKMNIFGDNAKEMGKIVGDLRRQDKCIVDFLNILETHKRT